MAIYLEGQSERYMVNLYFECRKQGKYPYEGSWAEQTQFTVELFEFLDNVVAETQMKNQAAAKSKKS